MDVGKTKSSCTQNLTLSGEGEGSGNLVEAETPEAGREGQYFLRGEEAFDSGVAVGVATHGEINITEGKAWGAESAEGWTQGTWSWCPIDTVQESWSRTRGVLVDKYKDCRTRTDQWDSSFIFWIYSSIKKSFSKTGWYCGGKASFLVEEKHHAWQVNLGET